MTFPCLYVPIMIAIQIGSSVDFIKKHPRKFEIEVDTGYSSDASTATPPPTNNRELDNDSDENVSPHQNFSNIINYSGSEYQRVNSYLRNKSRDTDLQLETLVARIDKELKSEQIQSTDARVLYRTVHSGIQGVPYEYCKKGQKFEQKAYLSTSSKIQLNLDNPNVRQNVLIIYNNFPKKYGKKIDKISQFPDEDEVLFPRGMTEVVQSRYALWEEGASVAEKLKFLKSKNIKLPNTDEKLEQKLEHIDHVVVAKLAIETSTPRKQ